LRTARLAVLAVPALVLAAACAPLPARSPEQVRADADIAARVYAAIKASPTWFYPALEVHVEAGAVYLTGLTFDPPAYDAATDIARTVPGVTRVTNSIVVDVGR
jgi:osmotically-inducible protein OsmY